VQAQQPQLQPITTQQLQQQLNNLQLQQQQPQSPAHAQQQPQQQQQELNSSTNSAPPMPPPLTQSGGNSDINLNSPRDSTTDTNSSKFELSLSQLADMGFTDRELNTRLIQKYNGDTMRVIQELLSQEIGQAHP
jgi:hypothetical protein